MLKAAAFFEIYRLAACAGGLLVTHRDLLSPLVDGEALLDRLTLSLSGSRIGYRDYLSAYFESAD